MDDHVWVLSVKYDPNQPRIPAGSTGGGRWTSGGGSAFPVRDEDWGASFGEKWHGSLTDEEKAAVRKYQGAGSYYMNQMLRRPVWVHKSTEQIDAITSALDRASTPDDVAVFRGFGGSRTGNAMANLKPGTIITDKGFVSTSLNDEYALKEFKSGGEIVGARIHVPKGSKAAYVSKRGDQATEWELLIQRGADFKVLGYSTVRGKKVIDLELMSTKPRDFFRTEDEYDDYLEEQEGKAAKRSRFQWELEDLLIREEGGGDGDNERS